ncbi:adenylate kinase family protein [Ureaplasma canigenitalium]|uniref:adenylate kinase family protein n=1 Tax=Ureaplasma canigenitalium TaxID=42092 RepID=UPI0004E187A8|nr:nucleoside monophosphate kinase [Ureaplasma canigenitalium]
MKIILIGAPGAGKGTISNLLIERNKLMHISSGNLFRKVLETNSPLKEQIDGILKQGKLVPDEITNKFIYDTVHPLVLKNESFVLDGYPRRVSQAEYLDTYCSLDYAFYLDIDRDILVKRLTGRVSCPECKFIYNIYFIKPKKEGYCDHCHIPLVKRDDDNIDTVLHRFKEFDELTLPLIEYYEKEQKLVRINANQDITSMYNEINQYLK